MNTKLHGFTYEDLEAIAQSLDVEPQAINVGNATGEGDELLPSAACSAAKFIRTALIAATPGRASPRTTNGLRDAINPLTTNPVVSQITENVNGKASDETPLIPSNLIWQTAIPTIPGIWWLKCYETDDIPEPLPVFVVNGGALMANDPLLGILCLQDLHDGLTSVEWAPDDGLTSVEWAPDHEISPLSSKFHAMAPAPTSPAEALPAR